MRFVISEVPLYIDKGLSGIDKALSGIDDALSGWESSTLGGPLVTP